METKNSHNNNLFSYNYSTARRVRGRVSRACNFCRQRKIKCDGSSICINCQQFNQSKCIYISKVSKVNSEKKKDRNKKDLAAVDRLKAAESKLKDLKIEIESLTQQHIPKNSSITSRVEDLYINEESNESIHGIKYNIHSNISLQNLEKFSASEFHYCRYPNIYVEWLKSKLPNSEHNLLIPLESLPQYFNGSVRYFESRWIQKPFLLMDKSQERSTQEDMFPENLETVTRLLDDYYSQDILSNYVYSIMELKELFQIQYSNTRKLSDSELLILNVALLIGFSSKADYYAVINQKSDNPLKENKTENYLKEIDFYVQKHFSNSLFFYQRISLLNEGVQTVRAFLMLLIYTEYIISDSRINLGLMSLAVRYAQDAGLDKNEALFELSDDQVIEHKRLWCLLKFFDIEMAYRKNCSPLIDTHEIKSKDFQPEYDTYDKRYPLIPNEYFQAEFSKEYIKTLYQFIKIITNIRIGTYRTFYMKSSMSHQEIIVKLDSLKLEMSNLSYSFLPGFRPLLFSDPNFQNKLSEWSSCDFQKMKYPLPLFLSHIFFYSHLFLLNMIPTNYDLSSLCINNYKNMAIDCCRTILNMASALDRSLIPKAFINTVIHQVSTAYLFLLFNCINNSLTPETLSDMKLLIKLCDVFFNVSILDKSSDFSRNKSLLPTENKFELWCVFSLRIGKKIFELQNPSIFFGEDIRLQEHIKILIKYHPVLFHNNREILQSTSDYISHNSHEKDKGDTNHVSKSLKKKNTPETKESSSNTQISTHSIESLFSPFSNMNNNYFNGNQMFEDFNRMDFTSLKDNGFIFDNLEDNFYDYNIDLD